jgi:hypothetical protein
MSMLRLLLSTKVRSRACCDRVGKNFSQIAECDLLLLNTSLIIIIDVVQREFEENE